MSVFDGEKINRLELAKEARFVLLNNSWGKKACYKKLPDGNEQYCMLGACYKAAGLEPVAAGQFCGNGYVYADKALQNRVIRVAEQWSDYAEQYRERIGLPEISAFSRITNFNDRKDVTFKDVIGLLDYIIEKESRNASN